MPSSEYNMRYDGGMFELILGPMFSGKTTELINRYNRYTIGGRKCIMIKNANDIRYDEQNVTTHNNIKVQAIVCSLLQEIDLIINEYDVICIDEIQFYKDAYIYCDKWANDGKIVQACGLNGTYNKTEFKMISLLIPQVENIIYVTAICKETGNNAPFSYLIEDGEGKEEIIGGEDKYKALDRITYNNYINKN